MAPSATDWNIVLWEDIDGVCPIERDLLKKMRHREKFLFASLGEKMDYYIASPIGDVQYHHELEKVKGEENMWELKFHLPKTEVRFLGCLVMESGTTVFYSLYAFKKKDQRIKKRHILTARRRVDEFINQYKKQHGPQGIL